eukprot:362722-Chlamydomonas_euryale.AAC.3
MDYVAPVVPYGVVAVHTVACRAAAGCGVVLVAAEHHTVSRCGRHVAGLQVRRAAVADSRKRNRSQHVGALEDMPVGSHARRHCAEGPRSLSFGPCQEGTRTSHGRNTIVWWCPAPQRMWAPHHVWQRRAHSDP